MQNWWRGVLVSFMVALFMMTVSVQAQSGEVRPIQANDVNNLSPLTLLDAHTSSIAEMNFSPAGKAFLTTGFDGRLCIWNVDQLGQRPGQLRFCLANYQAGITQFTWSPDDSHLAIASDSAIDIYRITRVVSDEDLPDFAPEMSLKTGGLPFLSLEFLTDARLLAIDVLGQLHLYHLPTANRLISLPTLDYVTFVEDSAVLLLNPDGQLVWLDAELGLVRAVIDAEADHMLVSPNQEWLLTWGSQTELWAVGDFPAEDSEAVYTLDTQIDGAVFDPTGQFLVTWLDETLTFWNTATGEITATLPDHRSGVSIVRWIDSGTRILTVSNRGTGRYWRVSATGIPTFSHWLVGEVDRIDVSPTSDSFMTMRESFDARFYAFENGQLRGSYPFNTQIVFSADWSLIASATANLVTWYGLANDPRQFDWMPFGVADGLVNIRETPSQDLPRIGTLNNGRSVFVRSISEDGAWLLVQLPDARQGWVLLNRLRNTGDVDSLSVFE